ncbi:MAG: sugar phosphate isomerase/epimerase [Anaerolineae bacterium]|nr:sugar phosphate isomerase/epimerase [Anaerolineae bacterium]
MPELALQLYTIREALQNDFEGALRRVAEIGFRAVETAGIYGGTPEQAARLFQSLGLRAIAAHVLLPLGEQKNAVIEMLQALDIRTLVCPWQPPELFTGLDGIQRVCDLLNEAHADLQQYGIRLAFHNHEFECVPLPDGTIPLVYMTERLVPEITFEVDVYWVHVAGISVPELLTQLGERVTLLHVKDGSGNLGDPMVAVGDGVVDFSAILPRSRAEAWIIELDDCATDMFEAVARSFAYVQRFL